MPILKTENDPARMDRFGKGQTPDRILADLAWRPDFVGDNSPGCLYGGESGFKSIPGRKKSGPGDVYLMIIMEI